MRRVIIIPSWYSDGFNNTRGIFFKEQAVALSKSGSVTIVNLCIAGFPIKQCMKRKFVPPLYSVEVKPNYIEKIIRFPLLPKVTFVNDIMKFCLGVFFLTREIFQNGKPDLFHLHSYFSGPVVLFASRVFGVPYILTEHSSTIFRRLSWYQRLLLKITTEGACSIIAVSERLRSVLQKITTTPVRVIPNSVDTTFFNMKMKIKPCKNTIKILSIGALSFTKGGDLLLDSYIKIDKQKRKNTKLVIVGDGELKNEMEAKVAKYDLKDEVFFSGRLDRKAIRSFYQESDFLVVSSRYETFGVSIIEAMACGLPVVSTRCGGPEDILNPEVGILCNVDVDSLSEAMNEMLDGLFGYDKELIIAYIKNKYSQDAVVKQIISLYESVLNR